MPPIRITIVPKNDEKELIEPDQMSIFQVKPFLANFLNLYLLLTSENVWKRKKNTYGEVIFLMKLRASVCNFAKSTIPLWVFFTFSVFLGGIKWGDWPEWVNTGKKDF